MQPEIWFYHLEGSDLETVLPPLLEKAQERGWRALVRTTLAERMAALDDALWSYKEESFLPHGRIDRPDPELQPILLTDRAGTPNRPDVLFVIDGAEPGEIEGLSRVIVLFDGRDEGAVDAARARWAALKESGHEVTYWQQGGGGRWEKRS